MELVEKPEPQVFFKPDVLKIVLPDTELNQTVEYWLRKDGNRIGSFQKRSIPHPEEISVVQRGEEGNCLKNVLNLYRMSKEKEGVTLVIFA